MHILFLTKDQIINNKDPPHDFLCPIMLNVMQDPVITSDGHSYDRINIINWFKHKSTSPVTGMLLNNTNVITNYTLKNIITEWKNSNY